MDHTDVQTYLESWIASESAEAPLLVIQRDELACAKILKQAEQIAGVEMFRLNVAGQRITIKSLRGLFDSVSRTTIRKRRLIILPHVERITPPAAHALLKQLEEPRFANRYLLTTGYPRRLLPTILSRVYKIHVAAPASPEESSLPEVSLAALLPDTKRKALEETTLNFIEQKLNRQVHAAEGRDPHLFRALLRLRDYYKIRSFTGNEKLAGDILLASVLELDKIEKN